jgi:hypothetical protein
MLDLKSWMSNSELNTVFGGELKKLMTIICLTVSHKETTHRPSQSLFGPIIKREKNYRMSAATGSNPFARTSGFT